ncbi:MAG TPA: branched-chain amino acid ABC transporter permease [Candidatus Lumbricidophila sp.]|nr:branched-chain amino acid ABC transporter permease [Candidatus Lumbricidophila sp.]
MQAVPNRGRPIKARWLVFISLLIALFATFGSSAPALAADDFDYHFSGNVKFEGKPLEGVKISVSGNGFSADTKTNDKGQWIIGVPAKGTYNVTLDEKTLPEGVIVAEGKSTIEAKFGLTKDASVNFFLGEGQRVEVDFAGQVLNQVFNGLNFGLLLALASIGLSLIFGTTGLSNFAHAEAVTFGALMVLTFGVTFKLPIWLAIPIALALCIAAGWALDAGIWKPLRKRGVGLIPAMIVSIGLSIAIRYVFQFVYGGGTMQLPGATLPSDIHLGPVQVSWIDLASMGTSIVVLLAVAFFLLRTRIGKATRAVSDNAALAAASGIDVDRVIRIVWVLGTGLAGLAGILWAYYRPGVAWDMGFQILLLIFAAVTLGGLGTAFGALVGSLVVGMFVEISTLWIPSDLKNVGALVVLILVLLFRPQGILGRRERIG